MYINYENGVERNYYLSDLSNEVLAYVSDNDIKVDYAEDGDGVYRFYRDGDMVYDCAYDELKDVTIDDIC
jgi:hypothetical protein